MAGELQFNRDYAAFGNQVRAFEKDDDVGLIVTELLWFENSPFYPVGAIIDAQITSVWLGEGDAPSTEDIDLIFRMRKFDEGDDFHFYEIVLRADNAAFYGGWVFGDKLSVSDEVVNGHRVLNTEDLGDKLRFVFEPNVSRYQLDASPLRSSTARIRRIVKTRR